MTTEISEPFESLPYFDDDLQKYPYLEALVENELARELKASQTLHPSVPPMLEPYAISPLLKSELERVAANRPFPTMDTSRYDLPAPPSSATDVEWKAALDNANAQLQHQRIRQQNLALLQTYGSNAWRIQNHLLEATAKQTEKALEELKELSIEVNRERKNMQDRVGKTLTALEKRWTELISSVLQIEMANVALEAEIAHLNEKAEELAAAL